MTTIDLRLQQLTVWTGEILARSDLTVSVASADASFRRYFRVSASNGQTWIVMDAPPEKEDVLPFINIAQMLVAAGINAPRVLAQNLSAGFLLLSDLGDSTYLTSLSQDLRTDALYTDALTALVQMQRSCTRAQELPPYDAALLRREMELFPDWFMQKHLGLNVAAARSALEVAFASLIDSALAQPQVFVHRDYHSRNLMIGGGALGVNPGVLDFQDAVCGPVTYDLVSLLRDCYVAWPLARVHAWVRQYRNLATHAGLNVGSEAQLLRWFDLMGVQRQLKAIGIFSRLWHRDGKAGYLKDIPRTLEYICTVAPAYDELRPLAQLIETQICPALSRL